MNRLLKLVLLTVLLTGCGKDSQTSDKPDDQPSRPKPPDPAPQSDDNAKKPDPKSIVVLTPAAAAQLRKLIPEVKARYLRISVSADNKYKLDLDDKMDPRDDLQGESLGVPIVVDRKSALTLPVGIIVDYTDADGVKGFRFTAPASAPPNTAVSLVKARKGFKTTLSRRESGGEAAPEPPARLFRLVRYDSPVGKLAAYLTPDPKDGKRHPAIIWITGGDCNSIDQGCCEGPANNDQSASAYRKAGIVMMFPSLRGGNDNPGVKEGFLGEVDDVISAAEFLRTQDYIDPARIYLGGHSTGGTTALLVAECSDRFRAVFSFGPVDDILGYGPEYIPFALSDRKELQLRSPGRWLHAIRVPVFVFEGTGGNLSALQAMARASKNPKARFHEVKRADHFNVLAPTNRLIADKILRDAGAECNLAFSLQEVDRAFNGR